MKSWYKTAQSEMDQGPDMETLNQDPPEVQQIQGPDMSRLDPSQKDMILEELYRRAPKLFNIIAKVVGVRAVEPLPAQDKLRNP